MATIINMCGGAVDLTKIYGVNKQPNGTSDKTKISYTADTDYDSLLIVQAFMNYNTNLEQNFTDGSVTGGTLTILVNQHYGYNNDRLTHNVYRWDNVKSGDTFTATSWYLGNMTVFKIG